MSLLVDFRGVLLALALFALLEAAPEPDALELPFA